MSNGGFEAPIGLGIPGLPAGAGFCRPGTVCYGVPGPLGSCVGSCGPPVAGAQLPGAPQIIAAQPTGAGVTQVVTDPSTGQQIVFSKKGKRRRMNYANQRALRRALRRATGYARQQKSIRKVASEFAREFGPKRSRSRADLPRGHRHVR